MLASIRQEQILKQVIDLGEITVTELSQKLTVSAETIRRDISVLDANGLLRKVHGGAVSIKNNFKEDSYDKRSEQFLAEKLAMGKFCKDFICDNDVIGLDTGVTTDYICKFIPNVKNLTIITSSISGLKILMDRIDKKEISPKIIFLGGIVNPQSKYTEGTITLNALEQFSLDKCFIASTAVSHTGIKMHDIFDGEYSKSLIKNSAQIFYVGASEKLGKEALYKVCGFENIHHFIVDNLREIPTMIKKQLQLHNVQCHIVDVGKADINE